jgi:hypothetical protein
MINHKKESVRNQTDYDNQFDNDKEDDMQKSPLFLDDNSFEGQDEYI